MVGGIEETVIFILAAGEDDPKWLRERLLLPVNGRPMVAQAAHQVQEIAGHDAIVVTHKEAIQDAVAVWYEPLRHQTFSETVLSTRPLWRSESRLIFLPGDMVWHDETLRFIFDDEAPLAIYGTSGGHAFGFACDWQRNNEVATAALETLKASDQVYLLRHLGRQKRLELSGCFVAVPRTCPPTMDIDLPKDYERYLRDWSAHA